MYAVGFIGTASSWLLMNRFGRRDIYFWGQVVLVSFMLITGILGTVDRESTGAQWAIGGLLICFALTYQFTVGPVCYSLVAEIGSTRLRSKTVVLARNLCKCGEHRLRNETDISDNIGGVIVGILNPYMLNSTDRSCPYLR
jgi:SP family general alpha glucoside:H+ symporter-like MFS transporter